jgi:phenylalanyl-tRNA synthetase alpha chain
MNYQINQIAEIAQVLKARFDELENKTEILKATELKALYAEIPTLSSEQRAAFGKEINQLKSELEDLVKNYQLSVASSQLSPIDITAPFDVNTPSDKKPHLLTSENGTKHPLMSDEEKLLDIFARMGFQAVESRQIDDDWHMFSSLNFPEEHPAKDDYDTFMTIEKDKDNKFFIAPAHTSTMQNRVLQANKAKLDNGESIAVVIAGRVFRNEDLDARHEHTFQQIEGIYVDKGVHAGHLIATLKTFLQEYYQKDLDVKTQPFFFPFTEPSFEFAMSCPFCDKKGCNVCSQSGWIEILGCGMIHPNVLKMADIDPNVYTGFAWGVGTMRLSMMKHNIEDIRHFSSGKLDFLRQFS